jgi:hypothetical protein
MKIEKQKLESIGFNPELDLSSIEDPMAKNRRLVSRILSGSFSFNNITKKGYANYVKVDKSLLDEFHQDYVGDLKVIDNKEDSSALVGRNDCEEFLEIKIL